MLRPIVYIYFFLLSTIILAGCESNDGAPDISLESTKTVRLADESSTSARYQQIEADKARPHSLFKEAINPELYELPSGALATWRKYSEIKPALVLFSSNFYLTPVPENLKKQVRELIFAESSEELIKRSSKATHNPLLISDATVSAALVTDLFSEIIFINPNINSEEELTLKRFQQLVSGYGLLTEEESAETTMTGGIIEGRVRGIPFRCTSPQNLPEIEKQIVLHIDLGYFKDLFKNEIKTPLYDLIHQLASDVRDKSWQTLAATLSYSNQEYDLALETRFIINDLASIMGNPEFLEDGKQPTSWNLRSQALYLNNMFSPGKAMQLVKMGIEASPNDPAAHFDYAMAKFQENDTTLAFSSLDKAVELDHGYALAYIQLAERGLQMGQPDKAIDLLDKAAKVFPDNPFIPLNKAQVLIVANRSEDALPIVTKLKKLPWADNKILVQLAQMEKASKASNPSSN